MEQKKRRQYTPAERQAVLGDVGELGILGAAKKHGVPQSCVSRWASAERAGRDGGGRNGEQPVEVILAPDEPVVAVSAPAASEAAVATAVPSSDVEPTVAAPAPVESKLRSRVAKLYTPSQKAQVLEHAAAHGVTAAALKFDISRFSIYDWQRKLTKAAHGEGPSPTSGPAPSDIEAVRDREILAEWHRHPGLGPSQIVNQLRRAGIKVGA